MQVLTHTVPLETCETGLKPPPDFVIIGAPKCGTTSLHSTLQLHSELFLSNVKEPHYFAFDYPNREVETLDDYDKLFSAAKEGQLRGESSTYYLSSADAVPAILKRRPDAKLIALVRNPVDLFVSFHNELLKLSYEDVQSPESAWRMQERRAHGTHIPKHCTWPATLQYKDICSLGRQLQRVFHVVPKEQRLVLVYDDLRCDPIGTIEKITRFLGVPKAHIGLVSESNKFGRFSNPLVPRLLRATVHNPAVKRVRAICKPFLNKHGIRPVGWLIERTLKNAPRPALSAEFRRELIETFTEDVRLIEQLLNRNLSHWLESETSKQI